MGTLRGNECAGVSNLQGLQVMLVKNNEEKHKKIGDLSYRDNVGKAPHNLQGKHVITIGKLFDKIYMGKLNKSCMEKHTILIGKVCRLCEKNAWYVLQGKSL